LIGTTDIRFEGDLDQVAAEPGEIDYLLNETDRLFPHAKLTTNQILYTYSGVRPLAYTGRKDEPGITRRHFIREQPQLNNLFSIVGGKLTTYRNLAEQCVDLLFRKLGKESPKCITARVPLPGAIEFAASADALRKESLFSASVNNRLLRIYGTRAAEVAELCTRDPALAEPFNKDADTLAGEVVFSFECEMAETLTDCLLRRTMIGLKGDLAEGDDEIAADIGKRFLGWNEERAANELSNYRSNIDRLRVR
jgi:glycerol-3-phosphate dehydrogenase